MSCGDPASCLFIVILSIVSTDGGTESLGITAGETKNPSESLSSYFGGEYKGHVSLPWTDNQLRILIFYVATVLLIGLNGENLSL